MAEEIELKLQIAASDYRRLQAHPILRAARLRTDQILDNHYFDTPDLALRHYGVALRLRKQGRQRLQTIKLAPKVREHGGLSIRPEWETPYRRRFDFSVVEVAPVRDWLMRPEIRERIVPLFRTRFRRVTWFVPITTGGEILVALDRGFVSAQANGHECREAISEVELELSGSRDVAALHALAAQLCARVALTAFDLSKAHRGYALLKQVTSLS